MQGRRVHGERAEEEIVGLGHRSPHEVLETLPGLELLEIKSCQEVPLLTGAQRR
jgi:hypothetical protein